MDSSAYRNMNLGGVFKVLLGFAAFGVFAGLGVFLWVLYLILTWIF